MATTKEVQQQVEKLNEELNETLQRIEDIGSSLSKGVRSELIGVTENTRNFSEGLLKSKNLSKDIAGLSSQLNKLNKRNVEISIERKLAEDKLREAAARYNREGGIANARSLVAAKNKIKELTLQLDLNQKLEDQTRNTLRTAEGLKKQTTLSGFISGKWKDITDLFSRSNILATSLAFTYKAIIDAGFRFSKVSTDISKNIGYGADEANRVASNLVKVAQSATNSNVTLQNAADAMNELATATGFVAEYSADALETQIMLTKQFGLQADEAAGIYKLSVLTGKSSKAVNDAMVGAFVATRNTLRVGVPFRATIAEAAKVSGQLAANLQNNPEQIVKAVVQAKALGTTLEQVKNQGESLLNFETSIENELKAELITGQQLNLERARAAALMGDQVILAQELSNQGMTLEKFQSMNVIAQRSFAEALGLSSDQLADQLTKQKLAIESGKSLAQLTEEEAKQAQQRQDAQTKFNLAVTKLQDLVGNLVAGPFGQLLDIVAKTADIILKIIKPFVNIAGSILNPILGGISGAVGAITGDDIAGYGARTLITPTGAVALNNNDTIIAGTKLFKGDDITSMPKGSLSFDNSSVVEAIKDLKQTLMTRPAQAFIQGENAFVSNITTKGVQNTYKSA